MNTWRLGVLGMLAALTAPAIGANIALYPTGPAQDAAFLRFVNTTGQTLTLRAQGSQAATPLDASPSATGFQAVAADQPIQGTLQTPTGELPLSLTVAPGEFASVVAAPGPSGDGAVLHVLREQPDDFNAMRASLALAVVDPACAQAGLSVAGRDVSIFQDVAPGSVARREINPVRLTVQARCAGRAVGEPLDLGDLAPGGRYTVFIAPSRGGTVRLFANDQASD